MTRLVSPHLAHMEYWFWIDTDIDFTGVIYKSYKLFVLGCTVHLCICGIRATPTCLCVYSYWETLHHWLQPSAHIKTSLYQLSFTAFLCPPKTLAIIPPPFQHSTPTGSSSQLLFPCLKTSAVLTPLWWLVVWCLDWVHWSPMRWHMPSAISETLRECSQRSPYVTR